ncbi:hypothetical protein SIN8267_02892 [Sinobacterium norvegicum]|uniref:DUF3305 domain-containing protein n=1 Tax=Sinobacterium norvegicum TaxID=1641715 RepID=A0ABN8EM06_9GAMM|nr:DUF3305 domain-containing protein [Sinobacterium norvegicum]CAH0992755.1 hypothetical protein SIN8267_02892 [Sinobacterium norvegicum]
MSCWPLEIDLVFRWVDIKQWRQKQWYVEELRLLERGTENSLAVYLMITERLDYRFNLRSEQPRLFLLCQQRSNELMQVVGASVTQTFAADYLDVEDHLMLDIPMPAPMIAWLEDYLEIEGEGEMPKKKKSRFNRERGKNSNKERMMNDK